MKYLRLTPRNSIPGRSETNFASSESKQALGPYPMGNPEVKPAVLKLTIHFHTVLKLIMNGGYLHFHTHRHGVVLE
jgi:hypothetical protein